MTFYLKYRPQTIKELDLEAVRQQLTQALQAKTIPHAFLFAGPRGLGKTSSARILAKAINCEKRFKIQDSRFKNKKNHKSKIINQKSGVEPCNHCEACRSITNGRALDVIEIDGASNRGIDAIRELKEKIKLSPVTLTKKVYVIDEVHMLTKEAFNALLKTLEEPPEHAFFILATTEPGKLPETIISRCFTVSFSRPNTQEIKRSLKRVVKGEKLTVTPEVFDLIATQADGSFRDAHKIAEQLAFAGKKIDKQAFDEIFAGQKEDQLLTALEQNDVAAGLAWVRQAADRGTDWKLSLQRLLTLIRDELLALYGVGKGQTFTFTQDQLQELVRLLTKAARELQYAPIPHLPVELAIIEYCSGENEQMPPVKKAKSDQATSTKVSPAKKPSQNSPKKNRPTPAFDFKQVETNWEAVLKAVKPQNHSVEALLRSARPLRVEGKAVVVEVFYEFHKGRLETAKCRQIVESSLQKVLHNDQIGVDYILGKRQEKKQQSTPKTQDDSELVKTAEAIFGG